MDTNAPFFRRLASRDSLIGIGFILAFLILIAVGVISYNNTTDMVADSNWVLHSYAALAALNKLELRLDEVEVARLSSLITRQPSPIFADQTYATEIDQSEESLRQLLDDSRSQQDLLHQLETFITQRLTLTRESLSRDLSEGPTSLEQMQFMRDSLTLDSATHDVLARLTTRETELLQQKIAEGTGNALREVWNVFLGIVLALAMFALVFILFSIQNVETVRLQKKHEQESTMIRTLIDNLPDPVYFKDVQGRYITSNTAHLQSIGFTAEALVGKTDFDVYPQEMAAQFFADERKLLESGQPLLSREEHTFGPGKKPIWALTSKVPLRHSNGQITGLVGVTHDVTERRLAEDTLKRFATELEHSNRELQDFASIASHDLQEPLRKIRAFGDRLQQKYAAVLDETGQDYLTRMMNASERMQVLINDLLTYSRVTSKAQPFVPVDLEKVAHEVSRDLEIRIEQLQGRVDIGPLRTIDADPTQMRQLLQNLMGNALKFHRTDCPPLVKIYAVSDRAGDCAVPSRANSDWFEFCVEDNGIGFEDRYAERIFQVFQRLHGRTEYEGTGIGLAICRKIVDRHGGSIHARSTPGQGSFFTVRLPIVHLESRAAS